MSQCKKCPFCGQTPEPLKLSDNVSEVTCGGKIACKVRPTEYGATIEQAVDNWNIRADSIAAASAVSAVIGYTSSLTAGTVITQEYMDRLNDYYLVNLKKATGIDYVD